MSGHELLAAARRTHYGDRDVARASAEYERALEHCDRSGDAAVGAAVATELANLRIEQGWWSEAVALVHDAKQRAARAPDTTLGVRLDTMTGEIALRSGDRDGARRAFARAIATARRTGHDLGRALAAGARVAQDDDRLDDAARMFDEAIAEFERDGDRRSVTLARFRRGLVALERRATDALAILEAAGADGGDDDVDPLIRREGALYSAVAYAFAGRDADARAALDRARDVPDGWTSSRHARHVVAVFDALVAAIRDEPGARARAADAALAAEAPGADGSAAVNCFYVVRAAVRLVRSVVAEARPITRTRVAPDGTWFQLVDGRTVELGHRPVLARLLAALVARERASVATLLEAAWPNQAAVGTSGELRVYTSIARLRKLGLRDHIEAVDGGYRFLGEVADA
jgi:tetratricopeptide (TPR) repeat protein